LFLESHRRRTARTARLAAGIHLLQIQGRTGRDTTLWHSLLRAVAGR